MREEFRLMAQVRSPSQLDDASINLRLNTYYCLKFGLEATPRELKSYWHFEISEGEDYRELPQGILAIISDGYISPVNESQDPSAHTLRFCDFSGPQEQQLLRRRQSGYPSIAVLDSNTIRFAPIPDKVYEIDLPAIFQPAPLSSDFEAPLIQSWGQAIVAGAAVDYLAAIGNMPRAQEVEAVKTAAIANMFTRTAIAACNERNIPRW